MASAAVVLPDPLSPTMPSVWPLGSWNDTSSTALRTNLLALRSHWLLLTLWPHLWLLGGLLLPGLLLDGLLLYWLLLCWLSYRLLGRCGLILLVHHQITGDEYHANQDKLVVSFHQFGENRISLG